MPQFEQVETKFIPLVTLSSLTGTSRTQIGSNIDTRGFPVLLLFLNYTTPGTFTSLSVDGDGTDDRIDAADWYRLPVLRPNGVTMPDLMYNVGRVTYICPSTTNTNFKIIIPILTHCLPFVRLFATASHTITNLFTAKYLRAQYNVIDSGGAT